MSLELQGIKIILQQEKKYIPLKPSNELTNSTIAIDTHNLDNNNKNLQLLLIKDEPQGQCMTLSQAFHIKTIIKRNK